MDRNVILKALKSNTLNEDGENKKESNKSKWYVDIQNTLDKEKNLTAPSQVGVMKSMGIEDDDKGVNRSLFGKKLHREKNDDGSTYEFSIEELGKIRAILGSV